MVISFIQCEEKPVPTKDLGEPFGYIPTALVPLYRKSAPSLDMVLLPGSRFKHRRNDSSKSPTARP